MNRLSQSSQQTQKCSDETEEESEDESQMDYTSEDDCKIENETSHKDIMRKEIMHMIREALSEYQSEVI